MDKGTTVMYIQGEMLDVVYIEENSTHLVFLTERNRKVYVKKEIKPVVKPFNGGFNRKSGPEMVPE